MRCYEINWLEIFLCLFYFLMHIGGFIYFLYEKNPFCMGVCLGFFLGSLAFIAMTSRMDPIRKIS